MDLRLLGLFWWWKDMKQWTRLWHPAQTSPSTECLRLHFGTLCWYQALFEGIVEIANAACTPLRPSSLQLDIACIPNVNMAEWWSGTCCTTSCYSLQPALPAQVNCPLSTIIKALPLALFYSLSLTILAVTTSFTHSICCSHCSPPPPTYSSNLIPVL